MFTTIAGHPSPENSPSLGKRILDFILRKLRLSKRKACPNEPVNTTTSQTPRVVFERSTDVSQDVRRLYQCYIFHSHPELGGLILRVKEIIAKNVDPRFANDVLPMISSFTLKIANLYENKPSVAKAAAIEYKFLIDDLLVHLNGDPLPAVEEVAEAVQRAITKVKGNHVELAKEDTLPSKTFSACLGTVLDPLHTALDIVKVAAGFAPVPYLKESIEAALLLITWAQQTKSNYDDMSRLALIVGEFILMIESECSLKDSTTLDKIKDAIQTLTYKLQEVSSRCRVLSQENPLSKFFRSGQHSNELRSMRDDVNTAVQNFLTHTQISGMSQLDEISKKVDEGFKGLRIESLPTLMGPDIKGVDYLPGSREADVDVVHRWLDKEEGFALWIVGAAGTGKSTLARHLAELLRGGNRLASLVHLGVNSTCSPSLLVQMMAHELAALHPRCSNTLAKEIEEPRPQMDGVARLFNDYLLKSIGSLGDPAPLVFIIDALDEWKHYQEFLDLLANPRMSRQMIRFIFTSRPLGEIDAAFRPLSPHKHPIKTVSDEIIRDYLQREFSRIFLQEDVKLDEKVIDSLIEQAKGLFIWVATLCQMIEFNSFDDSPTVLLKKIIWSPSTISGHHSPLFSLYLEGLRRLCRDLHDEETLRNVLRVMAVMQDQLSYTSFSQLSGVSEDDVKIFHRHLRSFYNPQQDWQPDTLFPLELTTHTSFRDFLLAANINSTPAHDFVIDHQLGNSMISQACHKHLKMFLSSREIPFEKPENAGFEEYILIFWMMHDFRAQQNQFDLDNALKDHLRILRCLIFTTSSGRELSYIPTFRLIQFKSALSRLERRQTGEEYVLLVNTFLENIDQLPLDPDQGLHPSRMVLFTLILRHSLDALEACDAESEKLTQVRRHTAQLYSPMRGAWMERFGCVLQ